MRGRKAAVLVGVVVLLGTGVGCGDSEGSGSGSGSGTGTGTGTGTESSDKPPVKLTGTTNNHGLKDVAGKDGATVELELDDFYFAPTFVKAKASQSLTVELKNEGDATHTFTVQGGPDEQVAPKETKTVTVTAPASGVLVYYCRFHQGRGMQGAVYLNEGDSAGASAGSSSYGY